MTNTHIFLYQEYNINDKTASLASNFLKEAVQDIFLQEISKFNGAPLKGKSNKVILKFVSIQDSESFIIHVNQLIQSFKDSDQNYDFFCLHFLYTANNSNLDKIALQIIKDASLTLKNHTGLFTHQKLNFSKHDSDFVNSIGEYYKYKILDESHIVDTTSQNYKAIIPKLFMKGILVYIIFQVIISSGIFIGSKYNNLQYNDIKEAIQQNDDFLLHRHILKLSSSSIDSTLSNYIDTLIFKSIKHSKKSDQTNFSTLKERVLSLEGLFQNYPNVQLYANLLGLYEKSKESIVPFYELESLLNKVQNSIQAFIIFNLSLDIHFDSYQLIAKCKESRLSEKQKSYILPLIFKSSLKFSLDGRKQYYKSFIENINEVDLESTLVNNLVDDNTQIRRNSYILLVYINKLEPYQFQQFLQFESQLFDSLKSFVLLTSNNYKKALKLDLISSYEKLSKILKRKRIQKKTIQLLEKTLQSLR
ncbi:MAG: hypothetical protein COB02_07525 [Candidatus Cloacimonadota bacterium]|nr:MAG: hypothetical protein COB02_07525 [Candidatus Cloacimonadota bacterium]